MKPSTQFRAIDALIGDEEQNGKQKKEKESGSPTKLFRNIWSPLTTRMDHTVRPFWLVTQRDEKSIKYVIVVYKGYNMFL